jgi:hypothetical protein
MPYRSMAQERFFHTDTAKRKGISAATVQELDQASKGMKLPNRAPKAPRAPRSGHDPLKKALGGY